MESVPGARGSSGKTRAYAFSGVARRNTIHSVSESELLGQVVFLSNFTVQHSGQSQIMWVLDPETEIRHRINRLFRAITKMCFYSYVIFSNDVSKYIFFRL